MLKIRNGKYCKVRDYCHCKDEYRGASHSICDLKYSLTKETTNFSQKIKLQLSFYHKRV